MKRLFFLFITASFFTPAFAQDKIIPLYDGPAPGSENWTWDEAEQPAADKANGTAVIIDPVAHSWDNAFAEPDYLSWMFSKKKKN